jgi:hypothetical protein
MNIGATFIANSQATMLEEPRDRSLNHPAIHAQSTAVFGPTSCQQRDNVAATQLTPMGLRIIGPVPLDPIRPPAGPAYLARNRGDRIDQGKQLGDIVTIGSGDLDRQGNAAGIGDQMMLGARFGSIRGIGPGLRPPKRRG